MTMLTWLPSVLRAEGLGVIEMPGWETRQTRTGYDPAGIVCHHTASSKAASDDSVRRLLRDGRSDLKGPLCQLGLERDGTFIVIAAGRGNHNGYGTWGNDSIGIEAYNDGVGEPWPQAQLDAYHRGVAAICRRMGWSIAQVRGHKETDPGRKIDPANVSMDDFRAAVARHLTTPKPSPKENLFMENLTPAEQKDLYERVKRLTPWTPERLDRSGVEQPPGTPNTVVADLTHRLIFETVKGIRELLKRP